MTKAQLIKQCAHANAVLIISIGMRCQYLMKAKVEIESSDLEWDQKTNELLKTIETAYKLLNVDLEEHKKTFPNQKLYVSKGT